MKRPSANIQLSQLVCGLMLTTPVVANAAVHRQVLTHNQGYAKVEILDDDLIHIEYGTGSANANTAIYASPMVFKKDYNGPSSVTVNNNTLETPALKISMSALGCFEVFDKIAQKSLTSICPVDLNKAWKGISIDGTTVENAYGLGELFQKLGTADGDRLTHGYFNTSSPHGNAFTGFNGGMNSEVQIPVIYAVKNDSNFALMLDNVYKQDWNFFNDWWQVRMFGPQVRFYIMQGENLLDLRKDYMELTGTPPVPPKKTFGLWVSEYGYNNWDDLYSTKNVLRDKKFPMDGFVLDLQWFGGTKGNSPDSRMGSLDWDLSAFPNPTDNINNLTNDHLGLMAIEESYVAKNNWAFGQMAPQGYFARQCGNNTPIEISNWFGLTGMIDWSNEAAGNWWHDVMRMNNLIRKGIIGHWTDLGDPESFDSTACYTGREPGQNKHPDVHNLYNLMWLESIYNGYQRNHGEIKRRPVTITRGGTAGIQRFGGIMWSGDIVSRLDVLSTHFNQQMHMSFAGIDYYGSDVGGFWHGGYLHDTALAKPWAPNQNELYTKWYANAAFLDIPLRPHGVDNYCGDWLDPKKTCSNETSPAQMGNVDSNLFNTRKRYELMPYYYSLGYRAYLAGEPVIAPLAMYFQQDKNVREMGHQKMIGPYLMAGISTRQFETERSMYLPAGKWVDYWTNDVITSTGTWRNNVPVYVNNVHRLPIFARAGAIIPQMYVDEQTKDAFGRRLDGQVRDELIVKVMADETASSFTLYEDDGENVGWYDAQKRPHYQYRTTLLSQQISGNTANITIAASQGAYTGSVNQRNNVVKLIVGGKKAQGITLNGAALPPSNSFADFYASDKGWVNAGNNQILIKTGRLNVTEAKQIAVSLANDCPSCNTNTQRTLVFIKKQTISGQDLYMRGGIDWNYASANLGRNCTVDKWLCAIPLTHRRLPNDPQRLNDKFLDWYGGEINQGNVQGSPLVWTTNLWPANWGTKPTLDNNGYGETSLNTWGMHYWLLDVDLDCSKAANGWFELKGFLTNSAANGGWEENVDQPGKPYAGGNHFARCGAVNVFEWGKSQALILTE